ncbi:MAG: hypothetical protein ETSY1_01930, partial [Candidatus Entotheonella factor]
MSEAFVESDPLSTGETDTPTATTIFPASYGQEALWFIHQDPAATSVYNMGTGLYIHSGVSRTLLRDIFDQLSQRHPALRTTFTFHDDQLLQVIHDRQAVCFEEADCSGQHLEAMQPILKQSLQRPFDLEQGPLWRVTLFTLSAEQHVLWMQFHHVMSDVWSYLSLLDELVILYQAAKEMTSAALPPLTGTYNQYVQWQRDRLDAAGDALYAYWQEALSGELPVLELPADHPRPPVQTYQSAEYRFVLDTDLRDRIRALARREGASFYAVTLAAFQLLLHRYSGQPEILTGIPTAGREQQRFDRTVGYFVNTLVLRSSFELDGALDFKIFLQQVKTALSGVITYRDYPFPWLVKDLNIVRDINRAPLCQSMLVMLRPQDVGEDIVKLVKGETVEVAGLTLSFAGIWQESRDFDIMMVLLEQTDGVGVQLHYHTDLFEEATIVRMAGHFRQLLEAIVDDPNQLVSKLPLLTDAERHQLLVEWTDTQHACPANMCFHELFEAQVKRSPEAEAVVDASRRVLTYRELNGRANQLAHYLRAQGVASEAVVGVCMERCPETVISLLAIFKAGGAYLPLDPALPADRLDFMLSNSNALAILTKRQYAGQLQAEQAQIICLDADGEAIAQQPASDPDNRSAPESLAYVIYTSGSTGLPKGAMVEHRGMVNHLYAKIIDLDLTQADRLAETAPQSFDISIWQFLVALLVGGAVHIFDDDTVHNPSQLLDWVDAEAISILEVVPSLLRFMLDDLASRGAARPGFTHLRWLLLTGEALPPHLCREWFVYYPDIPLMNAYGPTECSDDVTHHAIYEALPADAVSVPIGRPVANMRLYILDDRLQPTPIGVPGELYVGGIGVGRGYLNDPERTAAAFMADPFVPGPEARFYKTGDLVRYLPDGTIEFLGRLDHQVKIRGHRIELGEIETVLAAHPNVRQSLVTVYEKDNGDNLLVAYLVPLSESPTMVSELRQHLSEKLPGYMVPAAFFTLTAFPLTPNGKIDRSALPSPETAPTETANYVPTQTPAEAMLAAIWADVLELDRVGRHDNFFELGGHSLLAIRVLSRLREAMQVELSVRTVFEAPTVADLAGAMETAHRAEHALPLPPPLQPAAREGNLPLSFAQQRLWFLDQLEGPNPTYNILHAFRLLGKLQVYALEHALDELVQRHEVLRTAFLSVEGQPEQQIHSHVHLPLPVVDLQDMSEEEQTATLNELLGQEAMRPFDLSRLPLLRVTLYVLNDAEYVLQFNIHHIVSDAWSMGILLHELDTLYEAAVRGERASLPALPVQYADFAQWQRQWLTGEVLDRQLTYWRQQLADAPTLLVLPTDHPRPLTQTFNGRIEHFELDAQLVDQLRALSQQAGTSLFMTLYSVFTMLMGRYSSQDDIVVGTPIVNRHTREIEPLIGFFLNTLALRTHLEDDPSFTALLQQVSRVALEAYTHQDVPFEQLVHELAVERNLSHAPLFQVMFAWYDLPQPRGLGDLTMTPLAPATVAAKFDLTMFVGETQQQAGGDLWGMIEYNTDLFERATICRMIDHFRQLITGILADPAQPVKQVPLLTEAERRQLLAEWNATQCDYPSGQCVHQLFEAQVERTPEAVAVVFGQTQWRYRELNQQANQLAHRLQALGVGPNVLVGICLERSPQMAMSILAILKAGGAYVPLDPAYPQDRLRFMLDHAQVQVLLTQASLRAWLTPPANTVTLELDDPEIDLTAESRDNPRSGVTPDHLLYVIYTSGSTGRPKGVAMRHQPLTNLVWWQQTRTPMAEGARTLQFTPVSFDVSCQELFSTWCFGGTLVLVSEDIRRDGDAL